MPLFMCEQCGCIENTACGFHWTRDADWWSDEYRGRSLCSEHGPRTFRDGSPTGYGKWHGLFPRRSALGMKVDQSGHLWSKDQVDAGMLPKHYRIVGEITEVPGDWPAT